MAASEVPLKNLNQNGLNIICNPSSASRKSRVAYEIFKELESDEYGSQILSRFKEFRDEGKFCDVTLCVEDQQFQVHRMVLAGCSDYFKALFSHGMKDSDMDTFILPDISLRGFNPLLEFTYTGKLKVNFDLLPDVLSVATFLQMRPAIKLCQLYLKAIMSLEDSDEIVNLGMNFGLTELKDAQRMLILNHFFEFTETRKFYEMDHMTLIDFLKEDSLRIKSEGQLLKCVLRWYRYDKSQREEHIADVLRCIRYVQQGWPAIDFAEKEEPFSVNKKCKSILKFCIKYMQQPQRKHLISDHRTRVRFSHKSLIRIGGLVEYNAGHLLDIPFIEALAGPIDGTKNGYAFNHMYHKELEKWIPLGCIGTSELRSHCPLVYVNDHCVLVGGYIYTADDSTMYQHCTNSVHLVTPSENEFSMWEMPDMSETRAHHVAVSTPSFIYAIGGKNEAGSLRSVEQFHMESEIWSPTRSLPEPLFDHAGASIGETVYVSGGVEGGVTVKDVWSYNHVEGQWEERPPMLYRRAGHTMTNVNESLIVCGGFTNIDSMRCLNSVECFNLELQQWSLIAPMRQDCAYMGATVLDEKLIILGGVNSSGDLLRTVQQFDFTSKTWSNYCELNEPMQNAGVCALTVRLTETGENETDSLVDEYESRIWETNGSDEDYEFPSGPSDEESQAELLV